MPNTPHRDTRNESDVDRAFSTVERSLAHLGRLARPSRIFGKITDANGRPLDRPAYSVLARIEEFGPIRLTDLAATMEIDISTASRHVRALEERGLVSRTGAPHDQRASHLGLTEEGEDLLARSRALRLVGIRQRLDQWSDDDVCSLARLLERFAGALSGPASDVPERTAPAPSTTKKGGAPS